MSDATIVLAQLEVSNCTAELYLNNVPVTRIAPPKVEIENVAVEQLLVPGTNVLEVLVEPGPSPSRGRTEFHEVAFRPMEATGRLIRFAEGVPGLAKHGKILGETRFSWSGPHPDRRMFPLDVSTQIEMGPAHGRWGWQDAPPLTLDEALIDEACAVLEQVEMLIRHTHADGFWRLTELQLKDVQRAYSAVDESILRTDLSTLMNHYQGAPDPVMPRDREQHDFRLVGGGRLLELVDKDHSTSFKLRDPGDGSTVPYRIMLARIGNELRIVR